MSSEGVYKTWARPWPGPWPTLWPTHNFAVFTKTTRLSNASRKNYRKFGNAAGSHPVSVSNYVIKIRLCDWLKLEK